jgi:hypothetical protein
MKRNVNAEGCLSSFEGHVETSQKSRVKEYELKEAS